MSEKISNEIPLFTNLPPEELEKAKQQRVLSAKQRRENESIQDLANARRESALAKARERKDSAAQPSKASDIINNKKKKPSSLRLRDIKPERRRQLRRSAVIPGDQVVQGSDVAIAEKNPVAADKTDILTGYIMKRWEKEGRESLRRELVAEALDAVRDYVQSQLNLSEERKAVSINQTTLKQYFEEEDGINARLTGDVEKLPEAFLEFAAYVFKTLHAEGNPAAGAVYNAFRKLNIFVAMVKKEASASNATTADTVPNSPRAGNNG